MEMILTYSYKYHNALNKVPAELEEEHHPMWQSSSKSNVFHFSKINK
jgi:hypothetical protein